MLIFIHFILGVSRVVGPAVELCITAYIEIPYSARKRELLSRSESHINDITLQDQVSPLT